MRSDKNHPEEKQKDKPTSLKVGGSSDLEVEGSFDLPPPSNFQPGQLFQGKYEIIGKLGAGGMGEVYKARDLTLNRIVAIKILALHATTDEKSIMRFQQEARAAAALDHPGIVQVYEFATFEDRQPYIVMDFIDGGPLSDQISRSGNLPIERCLDIVMQITEALAYAHEKGIVHRDLKPANIMLVSGSRERQQVKIVDFGIAKIINQEGKAITRTGEVFGSPLYMSPEQCSGMKVDRRSDIYSLACVMYETLVGKPPHEGESALATALMHLQEQPLPLSAVRPDCRFPQALQVVLDKAMAKNVDDRYQSIHEFRSDLEKLQKSEHDELIARGSISQKQRIINTLKQRLGLFFGLLLLVSAAFINNLGISGFLYLIGGLLIVFSIPGLRGNEPIATALQRQSRSTIPFGRTELIVWIIFVPLLLGLAFLLFKPALFQ